MSRIVVTGINGFVGRHVARELARFDHQVVGASREDAPAADIAGVVSDYRSADLAASWPELGRVDAVIHLAGLSAVGDSFSRPQDYIEVNSSIITRMCESLLNSNPHARVLGVSSGSVYGGLESGSHHESSSLQFTSPYVVSKALLENQLSYYRERGLRAVVARPFNHVGPGQKRGFLVPDLFNKLSRLDADNALQVGNLDSSRDYTDVRDVARAYRLLITADSPSHSVYNICSGTSLSGRQVLEGLCHSMGRPVPVTTTNSLAIRATDPGSVQGDSSRITNEFGWRAETPLSTSLDDFVATEALRSA